MKNNYPTPTRGECLLGVGDVELKISMTQDVVQVMFGKTVCDTIQTEEVLIFCHRFIDWYGRNEVAKLISRWIEGGMNFASDEWRAILIEVYGNGQDRSIKFEQWLVSHLYIANGELITITDTNSGLSGNFHKERMDGPWLILSAPVDWGS